MHIREATVSDAKGIAKVHIDSWRTTYKNIVPDDYLKQLSYENREQLWLDNLSHGKVFIAENECGDIVGFATGGKTRSHRYSGYTGELYAIYILESWQGKRIGTELWHAIVKDLRQQGIYSLIVLVLAENPARYFYEAVGATFLDKLEIDIAGKKLNELVYGWESITDIPLK
jgi:GNAT superfamily N-acetyltransferase